ncbi:phosphoribosylaminoimidazole-succinocarboxamide synthase [Vararia minispora EC-137]|uniref:Phosphoribosylaminoimidazole-succinocarboxamide synthase n=1 Tax=Vararia minispora EC-137 TaxID=1314806 RepID=A0ACB8QPX2_9AGAM|nr:phosphoribosylaminoimidazole-succinocarboxamide synthase [Vararia minispora EC-137]
MESNAPLIHSYLPDLQLISRGKVRDIYATSSPDHLLFVASDRISAYDVILRNGIPDKGKLLTEISCFWFYKLAEIIPNHVVTVDVDRMPPEVHKYREQLDGRTMLVRKASVIPLEAIVRGYLTGSAWNEYTKLGTVHGIKVPAGLVESDRFPEPLFTPSTKAAQGAHDENISPERAAEIIGKDLYDRVATIAVELYKSAAEYALARGLILADTKFEFGLVDGDRLILVDEALTPDSSRYWPLDGYAPGGPQSSFDKQFLRDWLTREGFKKGLEEGKDGNGWTMSEEVVTGTSERYIEARDRLLGMR